MNIITKEDFKNYTKEEIVEVILKNKYLFKPEALLDKLENNNENNAFKALDEATQKVIDAYEEYIEVLKDYESRYGKGFALSVLKVHELQKLVELKNKIDEAQKKESKLNAKYEKIRIKNDKKRGIYGK